MSDELISVIIPVYNTERYVKQTMDSVINQTYRNIEILVVDDGSTDNSPSICDSYTTDNRVQVFHRKNAGVGASRQFGVDHCQGEYFVTIDSDDYISEDFVEKLYKTIKKNKADIAVCGVSCFNDGSNDTHVAFLPGCQNEKLVVTNELLSTDFYQIACDMLLTDAWNKMFRTQFVKGTNAKFELEPVHIGTELQFCHRLTLHCPVFCVCRESLLFHRIRAGSLMQSTDQLMHMQEFFEIITASLVVECKQVGISIKDQLSNVYYGLMGILIQAIQYHGGSLGEKHRKFKALVSRNNSYLRSHQSQLDRFSGFRTFRISRFSVPAFLLNNALWLDIFTVCYSWLRNLKYGIGK